MAPWDHSNVVHGLGHDANGFGIIEALVALVILGIAGGVYMVGSQNSLSARQRVDSSAMAASVDQAFATYNRDMLRLLSPTSCLVPSVFSNIPFSNTSGGLYFTSTIGQKLTAAQKSSLKDSQVAGPAVVRCSNPMFISNVNATNSNRLYYCLEFNQVLTAAPGSITASPHAFAEVAVTLVDDGTNMPASCSQFQTMGSAGAEVSYSLYWQTNVGGTSTYFRRQGIYFAKVSPN